MVALDGAVFAVHAFGDYGGVGPKIDMGWQPHPDGEKGTVVSTSEFYEGRYWLVETRSPAGYELLPRPVAVELTREGMIYDGRLLDPDADSAVAMAFMNADRDTAKFDIADFARGELPLTGASGVGMWALAGAVLQAMAALIARVVRE